MNVFVEKYKKWDYIDEYNCFIWLNKYGDVVKMENSKGENIPINKSRDYYGIDIEEDLTRMLSFHIAAEIDREIVNKILNGNF